LQSNNKPSSFNSTLIGLPKNRSVEKVILFIESYIEVFHKEYNITSNEKGLNHQFILCMNSYVGDETFFFHHENVEDPQNGNSAQSDIGVFIRGTQKAFFVLEAKRLDSTIQKYREKEYVLRDNGGGIERFKKEIHGIGLTYVGMIGYMQTDNFESWLEKINAYIDEEILSSSSSELNWKDKDKLILEKSNKLFSTYKSQHQCKTKDISMYHIWIDLI